jgi:deoxyribodipyrimidine photo-lyase
MDVLQLPSLEQLKLESVRNDKRTSYHFLGGETQALKRIEEYFFTNKSIREYKQTRDQLLGENFSSKLSAYLSLGCVSARYVYDQIKNHEIKHTANESTYWLYFELIWRDYFRFMMKKHRSKYFQQSGIKNIPTAPITHDKLLFLKWTNGNTGNEFIDALMIELKHTGYMSNRGRQNVASFLCNNLKLDWRYGAAYFEQQLIDYDVCNNWGNWAYLAGVGNDPRGKRIFDVDKQAKEYDLEKKHAQLWLKKTY